ncbi:MAG: serine/threonine-protein kinase [Planctomycetota bacterium]
MTQSISHLVHETRGNLNFAAAIKMLRVESDEALAHLIEEDGFARLEIDAPISLSDYLAAIGTGPDRELARDAAIDVVLRSLHAKGVPQEEAVSTLSDNYPELEAEILRAAMLGNALIATEDVKDLVRPGPLTTPCDLGPARDQLPRRYRLIHPVGSGITGWVYRAIDRDLSSEDMTAYVAVKVFHEHVDAIGLRAVLAEEAVKARQVDHSHAVPVLDRGRSGDGREYAVYKFIDGVSLDEWITDKAPELRERIAVIRDVASALAAVHAAGLIHCDLKPANVLVDDRAHAWLADFGHAVRLRVAGRTREERAVGNRAFAAPEQIGFSSRPVGLRSDVFGLGSLLAYVITGRLPNGASPEKLETIHAAATDGPAYEAVLANGDADLAEIYRRATMHDARDRHRAMADLVDDLTRWLEHRPIEWRKPSIRRRIELVDRRRPWTVRGALFGGSLFALAVASIIAVRASETNARTAAERAMQLTTPDLRQQIDDIKATIESTQVPSPAENAGEPTDPGGGGDPPTTSTQ